MPVLNKETFALMWLIEKNETLYDDCYRITSQTLERHPLRGNLQDGVSAVAASARTELSTTLRRVVVYCDAAALQEYLAEASIDWRDIAREFIADVLFGRE